MALPAYVHPQHDGVLLSLKVQPRASSNAIVGPAGNELRVKVTAPPVDAAANDALVKFLAAYFGCPRNQVELVRGHTSRHKVVKIYGVAAEGIIARLEKGEAMSKTER
jgi:uncharacterized protein